jgi:hypothetical protein
VGENQVNLLAHATGFMKGIPMSERSKKCSFAVLAGAMVAGPVMSNVSLYCSAEEMCRPEVADLAHVHQQERNQWDPAPQFTIAIQSSTAATVIGPIFSWPR